MYKIGDRVLFTFLGGQQKGVITEKRENGKWKIKSDSGIIYPFIYGKEPANSKSLNVLGVIVKKL